MTRAARPARSAGRSRARGGFTLVEILFALAITAMVGLGVSAMLLSVSEGTSSRTEVRRVNLKQKVVASRISAAIRSSRAILARDPNMVVLWIGDTRSNDRPDLSELCRIQRFAGANAVWAYAAPTTLTPDVTYDLGDDFDAITGALMDTSRFPGMLWGNGVTAWTTQVEAPIGQSAPLVRYTLTVQDEELSSTAEHLAAMRSR